MLVPLEGYPELELRAAVHKDSCALDLSCPASKASLSSTPVVGSRRGAEELPSQSKQATVSQLSYFLPLPLPTSCESSGSMSAQGKREDCHRQLLQASFQSSALAAQSGGLVQTVKAICLPVRGRKTICQPLTRAFLIDHSAAPGLAENPEVPAPQSISPKLTDNSNVVSRGGVEAAKLRNRT